MGGPQEHAVFKVPSTIDPDELVERMKLRAVHSTLIINGGTSDLPVARREDIESAMLTAVAELAKWPGPAVLTGGTDAGIFTLLGDAVGELAFAGPVIGVVPSGKVDADGEGVTDRTPIEPHHTHIVAVDGDDWGDETPVMMSLSKALARRGAVAVLVAGGGDVAEREVIGHTSAKRSVIVLEGTGRLADKLASDDDRTTHVVNVRDLGGLVRCLKTILGRR